MSQGNDFKMGIRRFLRIFFLIPYVFCSINSPGRVTKNVGQDVVIMWNTTNNSILSVSWGLLTSDGKAITAFISMSTRDSGPVFSSDLNTTAVSYKGRVSWVGDLSAGHAWFKITSLALQDTNQYAADIREQGEREKYLYPTQITVAAPPQFLQGYPQNSYEINEDQHLAINCTASGPPSPNITWLNLTDGSVVIKTTFKGSAIMHINKRYHAGEYECQARNNPNEALTTRRTTVTVNYPPDIKKEATPNVEGCIGRPAQLVCKANGVPKPSMILTDSSGKELKRNDSSGEIAHSIDIKNSSQFGNYTCIAQNSLGNASYVISLKEKLCSTLPPYSGSGSEVPAGIIAGVVIAGILAIAGLVIAIIFCYRRKTSNIDSRRPISAQERTVGMSSIQEEQYASVQHQQDNQEPNAEPIPLYANAKEVKKEGVAAKGLPQYAQVDKSKKKKHIPDELVYADLAFGEHEPRPTSANESYTAYADIAGSRQQNLEPQGRDVMI